MSRSSRLAEVEPERWAGWLDRFAASHGEVSMAPCAGARDGAGVLLQASDGASALLSTWWPLRPAEPSMGPVDLVDPVDPVGALVAQAALTRRVLLVLLRRGGWAVGLACEGRLLQSAHGTRYVQSRTAAGGWSQQRYARRRAGQADVLVAAASRGLARVLRAAVEDGTPPHALLAGGDRTLVGHVLSEPVAVAELASAVPADTRSSWPQQVAVGPLLDIPDPRHDVLDAAARRARCLRVIVHDPA